MLKKLKSISRKSTIFRIFCVAILTAALCIFFAKDVKNWIEGPVDMDSVPLTDLNGAYVTTDVYAILGNYAEYYEEDDFGKEKTLDLYYIIPIGDAEYIGLKVSAGSADEFNQIYDETYEYLNGTKSELTTTKTVTGTISKMSYEELGYYNDWFNTSGYLENPTAEEISKIALPYTLKIDTVGSLDTYFIYGLLVIVGILVLWILVMICKWLFGFYVKDITKLIKNNGSLTFGDQLESDFQTAVVFEKLFIGRMYLYYFKKSNAKCIATNDIIWAYFEQHIHRTNGIKTSTVRNIVVYTSDKKKHTILMKKEVSINQALSYISQIRPQIVIGFSEELKRDFKNNSGIFTYAQQYTQQNPQPYTPPTYY